MVISIQPLGACKTYDEYKIVNKLWVSPIYSWPSLIKQSLHFQKKIQ